MEALLRYRGRDVTRGEVEFIRALIADNPGQSRLRLSKTLSAAWNWRQRNGQLRDMVCRGLMLALHRAGHIELPKVRQRPYNPLAVRRRPQPVEVDRTVLRASLRELGPLTFCQVRRTGQEALFNWLLASEHYLGYTQPNGLAA